MSIPQPSKLRAGFTLVELLIVVIILAILAAIVIPQFSSATRDTQESALDANLAGLRNAIELYKVQHADLAGRCGNHRRHRVHRYPRNRRSRDRQGLHREPDDVLEQGRPDLLQAGGDLQVRPVHPQGACRSIR